MGQVFISYSRNDQAIARELHAWLLERGFRPWMDERDIPAGVRWTDEVDVALRASRTLVGLLSASALESTNVKNEWDWAIANGRRLILLKLEECDIPFHYVSLNFVDYEKDPQAAFHLLERELARDGFVQDTPFYPHPTETGVEGSTASHGVPARTTTLPIGADSIIGREDDIAGVERLLALSRLITIVGPGGAGKTRLALAVASLVGDRFRNGAHFVSLVPVDRPELVVTAIIRALGLQESGGERPNATLLEYVRSRQILLVLDNFEHVLDIADLVTELLNTAPELVVLATSRIPLNIRSEQEYLLQPLALSASSELFIRRMRDRRPDYQPSDDDLTAIEAITRRLDGLPLAIELAAARTRMLTPQALLQRLERPLEILTGGRRDLFDHQRTLRGTIAWSYDLLEPDDQALFRVLSVFVDGWSMDAAEFVAPEQIDVFSGLERLVESNLAISSVTDEGEPWFRMLETIREFGRELLVNSGEEAAARERHARYYDVLIDQYANEMYGLGQVSWLKRLDAEHANIRAALDWYIQHEPDRGMRVVAPLWLFWWLRRYLSIGRHYYETFLDSADHGSTDQGSLGLMLTGAGIMAEWQYEFQQAIRYQEQALEIWSRNDHPPQGSYWSFLSLGNIAMHRGDLDLARHWYLKGRDHAERNEYDYGVQASLDSLGRLELGRGNFDAAVDFLEENLHNSRRQGDAWTRGLASASLGEAYLNLGRFDESRVVLEESLDIARSLDHTRDMVLVTRFIGYIDLATGNLEDARWRFEQTLADATKIDDLTEIGMSQVSLGELKLRNGSLSESVAHFRDALETFLRADSPGPIALVVDGIAKVEFANGALDEAVRLLTYSNSHRERYQSHRGLPERQDIEALIARASEAISTERFQDAVAMGQRMTLDQIVAEILDR